MTNQAAVARIEELAQRGELEAAERACHELLGQSPHEHRAWAWLGIIAFTRSRPAEAERALRQAIEIQPLDARYWHPLSAALRLLGRAGEAEAAARQAVALDDSGEHWAAVGNCLFDQQRWAEAAEAYRQSVARQPHDAQAWTNLGAVEQAQGRLDSAREAFERSLALAPEDLNASLRYALLQMQCGDVRRAIELIERILARAPQLPVAWQLLGNALRLVDDFSRSEAAFRQALALAPDHIEARYNLALVLIQQMRPDEAEHHSRQLLESNPQSAEAWIALGGALNMQARMKEAIEAIQQSLALSPNSNTHSKLLAALHYSEDIEPAAILVAHREWDAAWALPLRRGRGPSPSTGDTPVPPRRSTGETPGASDPSTGETPVPLRGDTRSLRLGFVGMDFSGGPTRFLALRALECLDQSKCSVICYADRLWDDAYSARFRAAADEWRTTLSLSDEELAEQVRRDEIDVLVDLGGHVGRRLLAFARCPAALQVTWMGYVGTTGVTAMDCLLADRYHVRAGEEQFHSEAVLRMPHDYICYGPPPEAPAVGRLPAIAAGRVTFGCFNNPAKFAPSTLDAWAAILRRLPESRLLLKYGGLDQSDRAATLGREFVRRGVTGEQILLEGWSDNLELMAHYGSVDLALDTQPYSGGLTTCEALWMGVPVITRPGTTFASRHATSHVTNAGYGQFVASDWAGYVDLAVHWAARLDELARMRAAMRERMRQSPLCDGERFARDFLDLVWKAWEARSAERGARSADT